jgi:hypothetical protein
VEAKQAVIEFVAPATDDQIRARLVEIGYPPASQSMAGGR